MIFWAGESIRFKETKRIVQGFTVLIPRTIFSLFLFWTSMQNMAVWMEMLFFSMNGGEAACIFFKLLGSGSWSLHKIIFGWF